MAAVTPSSLSVRNMGGTSILSATFPNSVDDGDTWASNLGTRVVDYWTQDAEDPSTQASVGVAISDSSGTFTFYPAENNKSFYLFARIVGC